MRWTVFGGFGVVVVGVAVRTALAAEFLGAPVSGAPMVGAAVGAAVPTSKFRKSADAGGSLALFGGYRLMFGERFALSLLGEPQFSEFASKSCSPSGTETCPVSGILGMFSLTLGPRFSLLDGPTEVYFGFQGGYYTYLNGPLDDSAAGLNVRGGVNYEIQSGTSLGVFLRYDTSQLHSTPDSTSSAKVVIAGLGVEHRFLPPPPVVVEAAPPPPPPPPPVKKKLVLRGVNFDFNKATIRPDARPVLDEAIATLKESGNVNVAVDGYTDSIGTEAYNDKLSLRRARAVFDYLKAGGIAPDRMTVQGFGESHPVASNDTEEGRAQNRRVELRVISGAE